MLNGPALLAAGAERQLHAAAVVASRSRRSQAAGQPAGQTAAERARAPSRDIENAPRAGARQQAEGEWQRATAEVEPLRQKLQDTFLSRTSWLGRRKPALAASASEMGIDEVRVCQVYVYGLASRLAACAPEAAAFAESANMRDVNSPLLGYDEARWDPTADLWRRMEMCVHRGAAAASTDLDRAWRHGKG